MNVQLENPADKKTAIFESTLNLVKENGFHGTPMSQIARNASVAAGTIYHYFESKDELINELFIYVKDQLGEAILREDDPQQPYRERFMNFWVSQCSFFIEHESFLYFLEQYMNSPYAKNSPESKVFKNQVKPFIQEGIDSGKIRTMDYELLAPIIHGSIVAATKIHLSGRQAFTKDRLRGIAEVIWDGIRVQ